MKTDKDIVYVCGHRHPDTDSIASAIAYADLKNKLGTKAVACRLGDLNDETDYVLEKLGFAHPVLLKDARATLDEIEMDEAVSIHIDASIKDAMDIVQKNRQTLAVVDDRDQLLGLVTNTNLSHVAMGDTAATIELLKRTSVSNITKAIDGILVYEPEQFKFNGKTSIVALSEDKLANYDLSHRLVILGNDETSQIAAIEKGAACLVLVWTDWVNERVVDLAKAHDCAIIRSTHGTMNTSRYLLFAPSVREVMTTDLTSFNMNEFVEDVGRRMLKSRFRSYPVTDDQNRIYGFISRYHILNSSSKKLILVDHNEYSQSVEGIENADVLEVIDHHRIGDLSSVKPIYFRNEIIGSTSSIVAKMYQEHNIEMPKNIAALLQAALISDTLNLKSPTTTEQDVQIMKRLESISGLDRFDLAKEIYEVTSSFKNKTYDEIINQDIKTFYISNKAVMVSQVLIYHFKELDPIFDAFKEAVETYVTNHRLDLLVVVFTSIEDNGSIMISAGALKEAVLEAFPKGDGKHGTFLADVVSRKNQIIPRLASAIESFND